MLSDRDNAELFSPQEEKRITKWFNTQFIADLKELHKRYTEETVEFYSSLSPALLPMIQQYWHSGEFSPENIVKSTNAGLSLFLANISPLHIFRSEQRNLLIRLTDFKALVMALKDYLFLPRGLEAIVKTADQLSKDKNKEEESQFTYVFKWILGSAVWGMFASLIAAIVFCFLLPAYTGFGLVGTAAIIFSQIAPVGVAFWTIIGGLYSIGKVCKEIFYDKRKSTSELKESICNTIKALDFNKKRAGISTGTLVILFSNEEANQNSQIKNFIHEVLPEINQFLPSVELDYVGRIEHAIDQYYKAKHLFSRPSDASRTFIKLFNENKIEWKINQKLAEEAVNDYVINNPSRSLAKVLLPIANHSDKYYLPLFPQLK